MLSDNVFFRFIPSQWFRSPSWNKFSSCSHLCWMRNSLSHSPLQLNTSCSDHCYSKAHLQLFNNYWEHLETIWLKNQCLIRLLIKSISLSSSWFVITNELFFFISHWVTFHDITLCHLNWSVTRSSMEINSKTRWKRIEHFSFASFHRICPLDAMIFRFFFFFKWTAWLVQFIASSIVSTLTNDTIWIWLGHEVFWWLSFLFPSTASCIPLKIWTSNQLRN